MKIQLNLNQQIITAFAGRKPIITEGFQTRYVSKKTGGDIFIKNGRAYDKYGKPYSGTALCSNKQGGNVELDYNRGRIVESRKDGEMVKRYAYPVDRSGVHTFADGSYLDEKEFYGTRNPRTTVIYDGRYTTTVQKYQAPTYKYQPILDVMTSEGDQLISNKRYVKTDGKPKPEFKTLNEAKTYFSSTYGITADFDTLAQAHIVRDAIDDFVQNTKVDKDAFAGLFIATDKNIDPLSLCTVPGSEDESEADTIYVYDDIEEDESSPATYYDGYDYSFVTEGVRINTKNAEQYRKIVADPTILLNHEFDWSTSEVTETWKKKKESPASTLKGLIQHELAHHLHSMTSPYFYAFGKIRKYEKDIAKKVSDYAKGSPAEFVAEYVAGRLEGNEYPSEVNKLYKKFGGPDIFYD